MSLLFPAAHSTDRIARYSPLTRDKPAYTHTPRSLSNRSLDAAASARELRKDGRLAGRLDSSISPRARTHYWANQRF
ncbi:hypothetical protein RRG08_040522 [Elysia crispata]|uniref:Uncharacterized protein n=1 Tax=Elysia crispata TaxID=231223 RepID=A0AAE1DA26_9GAST|nr:hypothetical protein RRG08_040522 [Elysia crispata]